MGLMQPPILRCSMAAEVMGSLTNRTKCNSTLLLPSKQSQTVYGSLQTIDLPLFYFWPAVDRMISFLILFFFAYFDCIFLSQCPFSLTKLFSLFFSPFHEHYPPRSLLSSLVVCCLLNGMGPFHCLMYILIFSRVVECHLSIKFVRCYHKQLGPDHHLSKMSTAWVMHFLKD
ncbi:hypothetical protein CPB84DRAFT_249141 [Gymnopilus junonius]|uniref:Uncharacterized protein n=1 Tax=Gymnopilus junonius TaxID=109634 RepID=A0A9P5TSN6_GYMJU|nr:hypothetical protein CPB84DRAFT_249141 [Gymnopilus junonius]